MAAEVLAKAGTAVTVCDAMPSSGRKFLMAGKSGLNLTKSEPFNDLAQHFGAATEHLRPILKAFDTDAVQAWASGLGQELFTGPTGRVFPTVMKASPLLRAWLQRLDNMGVQRRTRARWIGWDGGNPMFKMSDGKETIEADAVVLALGGASWSRLGSDGKWQEILAQDGVQVTPFGPSNAAISVDWSYHMRRFFGAPLKALEWRAGNITSRGEAILSSRGIEGGGVYNLTPSLRLGLPLIVDLAPDQTAKKLQQRLDAKPDKLRLGRWLKNALHSNTAKMALFNEMTAGNTLKRENWVATLKHLPIRYAGLRPMDEAISTSGGVPFEDLTDGLMLKARPGVFCAGEMLDWEAPTGGYLITGCLASGRWAAQGALRYLASAA